MSDICAANLQRLRAVPQHGYGISMRASCAADDVVPQQLLGVVERAVAAGQQRLIPHRLR